MSFENYIKGIRIIDNPFLGKTLCIDGDKLEDCAEVVNSEQITKILISGGHEVFENLMFLNKKEFSQIDTVTLSSSNIKNVEVLYKLKNLNSIGISNIHQSTAIDFEKLTSLKSVSLDWSKRYSNIDKLADLEDFKISKYPYKDLAFLNSYRKLKCIELTQSKVTSLKGIDELSQIEKIELHYNKNLVSLNGISFKHKNLKHLSVYSSPKLFEVNKFLSNAINLELIHLAKVKEIDSFKFLNKLDNLKKIQIKADFVKVKDNNYMPLKKAIERTEGNGIN